MKFLDLTNRKFGRLTVKEYCGVDNNKKSIWTCVCSCGKEKQIISQSLISGRTKSCGCLISDVLYKRNYTHGFSLKRFYRIWAEINTRCYNKNRNNYKDYGGRGIKCEWKSFLEFKKDMYKLYCKHIKKFGNNTSIDRINNNGNYCKENCRWATRTEQNCNTRRNKLITYNNKTQTASMWSKELNINRFTIYSRIRRNPSECPIN